MEWSEALDGALPPPRDSEPSSLRQDIEDELRDHLQSALRHQLLRTPDENLAREVVLDRFGNPQRIARQLWYDALKEKMMPQRLMVAMMVLMTVICAGALGLTYVAVEQGRQTSRMLVAQLGHVANNNIELSRENLAANEALLAQIGKLSASPAVPLSLEWSKVKITLVPADPQKGALPPGFTAWIMGRILNAGEENSIDKKVGTDGVVDFGLIRVGSHELNVMAPWGEHFERRLEVQPGETIAAEVKCPIAAPAMVDVAFSVDWPADLLDKKLCLVCGIASSPRDFGGPYWLRDPTLQAIVLTETGAVVNFPPPGDEDFGIDRLFQPHWSANSNSPSPELGWRSPGTYFVIPELPAKTHVALPALDYRVPELLVVTNTDQVSPGSTRRLRVIGGLLNKQKVDSYLPEYDSPLPNSMPAPPAVPPPADSLETVASSDSLPKRSGFSVLTLENQPSFQAVEGQANRWKIKLPDELYDKVRATIAAMENDTDQVTDPVHKVDAATEAQRPK